MEAVNQGNAKKPIELTKAQKIGISVGIGIAVLTLAILAIAAIGTFFLIPVSIVAAGALTGAAFAIGGIGIGASISFIWDACSKKDDNDSR